MLFIKMNRRKKLKNQYKNTLRAVGIFQIRNMLNEKVLVGSSMNLDEILNRHKFELKMGGHKNQLLQNDWNEFGEENFAFEILEELQQREGLDLEKELKFLEDLWLGKLQPFGENGYIEKKKTRDERLRMIAANRRTV